MNVASYRSQLEKKSNQEIAEILATPKDYQEDFILIAREIAEIRAIGQMDVQEASQNLATVESNKAEEKLSKSSAVALFIISPAILVSMVGIYVLHMVIGGIKAQGYHKKASQMWLLFMCGSIGTPFILFLLIILFFFIQSPTA